MIQQREMGPNQKGVLRLLQQHGSWQTPGLKWVWDSPSRTALILDTLVRRGLATRDADGVYWPVKR